MIADSTPNGSMGKAFGLHRAMDHTGAVIGPLLAFLILSLRPEGYRLLFWCAALPAVLSVLVLVLFVSERTPSEGRKISISFGHLGRKFKLYLLIVAIFTLGNSSDAFLLLRARHMGVPATSIPLLWVALHIVKMLTSVPGGTWSDRVGRRRVIAVGWAIYALIYLGFALASRAWHISGRPCGAGREISETL